MSSTGTRVVKNASILMLSQLITWTLTLLLTIFLPRYLGAEMVGEYTLAWSVWAIAGVMISFGMDTLLTKEIARDPLKTSALIGTTIVVRVLLYALCLIGIGLYLYLTKASTTTIALVGIISITQIFTQFYAAFQSALTGLELMKYVSISDMANKAIYSILGVVLLLLGYGVYGVATLSAVAAIISFLLLFVFLRRHHQFSLHFDLLRIRLMLRVSLPYLVSGLGLVAYCQVDILTSL